MDLTTAALIGAIVGVVLLVLGMPIGFMLIFVSFLGVCMIRGLEPSLAFLGDRPYDSNSSYELSVVPLFLLMGHLAYSAGITQGIYNVARHWLGQLKGGLVIATTTANAIFGACCGSTTAATAVFGKVAIPEMIRHKVNPRLAAGCVAAAGSLSSIIPPSIHLVVYGLITNTSIARMLMAGIIPGIMTAVIFGIMVYTRARLNPSLAPPITGVTWRQRFQSFRGVWGILLLIVLVLGGIWAGVITPTEGGGIGATGAFFIVLGTRKLTRNVLRESFLETARSTAVILIIVTGALMFTTFIGLAGVSETVTNAVVNLPLPPIAIIWGFMGILIIMGCFVEPMSMMFLTMPFMIPVVKELGFDPVWFGVLVVTTCEIGMVTPPMGLNCYMLKSVVPELAIGDIFKGTIPFIAMFLIAMGFMTAFPQIALVLPNAMYSR